MTLVRPQLAFAATFALLFGSSAQFTTADAGARIWGPDQAASHATSSTRIWTAPVHSKADVPAGADDEDPEAAAENAANVEEPVEEAEPGLEEYSVTTISPSFRNYRLRRALGQRYTGFKKQYRGQRYTGFKRNSRIRKYRVRRSKLLIDPANKHIWVLNRRPVPFTQ